MTVSRPRPLTIEDHQATAAELLACRRRLITLLTGDRYLPKTSRAARLAKAMLSRLDQLRSELDDQVHAIPGVEDPGAVYYQGPWRERAAR